MTIPTPLSLAEWVVLAVVDEGPTHGFAVAQLTGEQGELGRVWQIPRPIVYRALQRLEASGLISAEGTEAGRGPRRQVYAVTSTGHRRVLLWLRTPVDHVRDVRSHLLLKLALLDRRGKPVANLVAAQRLRFVPIASALDRPAPTEAQGFEATLVSWRRSTTRATLAFLDEMAAGGP